MTSAEKKRFRESDPTYLYAKMFQEATEKYLEKHKTPKFYGLVYGYESVKEIIDDLESCAAQNN